MAEWYYMFNGQQNGPVSGAQLKSLAATGGLGAEDLIWNETMKDWVPAQRVKGLVFAKAGGAAVAVAAPVKPAPVQPAPEPAPAPAPAYATEPAEETYEPAPAAAPAEHNEYETAPEAATLPYASPPESAAPGMGEVSDLTITYLKKTRPWVMLMAILGFIGVAGILAGAVVVLLMGLAGGAMASKSHAAMSAGSAASMPPEFAASTASMPSGGTIAGFGLIFAIFMFIYAALLFFPAMFLMKYSSAIKRLTISRSITDLEAALRSQKNYWMFIGIIVLIGIVLSVVSSVLPLIMMR